MPNADGIVMDSRSLSSCLENLVQPRIDQSALKNLLTAITSKQVRRTLTVARICESLTRTATDPTSSIAKQIERCARILHSLSPERREAIALDPAFNAWLNGMQQLVIEQRLDAAIDWGRQLIDFIWAEDGNSELRRYGWSTQLDDRGGLRLKAARGFLEFGRRYAGCPLVISYDDSGAQMHVSNGPTAHIPLPLAHLEEHRLGSEVCFSPVFTLTDARIECTSRDPAYRVAWLNPLDRQCAIDVFAVSDRCFPNDIAIEPIAAAFRAVAASWPEVAAELPLLSRVIVPMDSGDTRRMAITLPSRNGAIFVDLDTQSLLEEALVHEHGHIKLRYLQDIDPLLKYVGDDARRFTVPWRQEPRPLAGIFEAVFVYLYVAEYAIRRARRLHQPLNERPAVIVGWIGIGLELLREHAQLTDLGNLFLTDLAVWHHQQQGRCKD